MRANVWTSRLAMFESASPRVRLIDMEAGMMSTET